MNAAAPDMSLWIELFVVTGCGTALIAGSAALLARLVGTPRGRRFLWHGATLCLAALVLGELTGSAPLFARLLRAAHGSSAELPTERSNASSPTDGARADPARADTIPYAISDSATARTEASPDGQRLQENPAPAASSDAVPGIGASGASSPSRRATFDRPGAASILPAAPEPLRASDARSEDRSAREPIEAASGRWWPGIIWGAGAAALLSRALFGWSALFILLGRRGEDSTTALAERARALAGRLGFDTPVRVVRNGGLSGPLAAGILRPTIGIPESFDTDYDPPQQDAMLLHELAHLAGRDPAWQAVSDLVTIALWWHPLAWWARHELRVAGEFAADEASAVVEGGPDALAASLVKVGGRLARPGFSGLTRVEGSGFRSGLGRRVERLLRISDEPAGLHDRPGNRLSKVTMPAVMVAALACSSLWLRPLRVETDLRETTEQGERTMTKTLLPLWKRSVAGFTFLAVLGAGAPDGALAGEDGTADTPVVDLSETPRDAALVDQAIAQSVDESVPSKAKDVERRIARLQRQLELLTAELEATRKEAAKAAKEKEKAVKEKEKAAKAVKTLKALKEKEKAAKEKTANAARGRGSRPQPLARPLAPLVAPPVAPGIPAAAPALPALVVPDPTSMSSGLSDTSSQADLIGLATKLADAVGDARLARLRYSRVRAVADENLVSQDELDVARINLETAEQKIRLLREIARAYLRQAESRLVYLAGERERLRRRDGKPDESRLRSVESQLQASEAVLSVLKSLASIKEPDRAGEGATGTTNAAESRR